MKTVIMRMLPYALILGAGLATPVLANAQATAGYSATLAKAVAAPRSDILEGVMWTCMGNSCVGADEGQRPSYICRQVVRKYGAVTRFASNKGELAASDLTKCNAIK